MTIVLGIATLFFMLGANPQPETTAVKFCELIEQPSKFEGKTIEVHATLRYGDEWMELYCLGCTKEGWLPIGLGFSLDNERTEKQLRKMPFGTVNVKVVGTFRAESRREVPFHMDVLSIERIKTISKVGVLPHALKEKERKQVCHACSH